MKMAAAITPLALLAACASPPADPPAETPGPASLQELVDRSLEGYPGQIGVYVKDLGTGEEAMVRPDGAFNSASVIKIPVLVLALQQAERGGLSLDERVELRADDLRPGSGIFQHHDLGLRPTIRDVLLQMIMTSDNTATDLAIQRVGGVDAVNKWIADAGFGDGLRLHQTTGELFRKYLAVADARAGLFSDRDVHAVFTGRLAHSASPREGLEAVRAAMAADGRAAAWNERTVGDQAYWLGSMTPRATGRLLEAIERGALASEGHTQEMRRMLRAQLAGSRRLPHYLTVPVAHKTGDFSPVLANDVGIIYASSGPIVMAVFANAIEGPYAEAEGRQGRLAQQVVDYLNR
jgi:beta-lactamase class A